MIDTLLVWIAEPLLPAIVLLLGLLILMIRLPVKPAGRWVVFSGTALWLAITIGVFLSQTTLAVNFLSAVALIGVIAVLPNVLVALAILKRGIMRYALGAVAIVLPLLGSYFWLISQGIGTAWVGFSLVAAYGVFRLASAAFGRSWTSFVLGLLVVPLFWLIPNDNWLRLAATARVAYLCATDSGNRVVRSVQGVDGLTIRHRVGEEYWIAYRGLKYVEWSDWRGKWRMEKAPTHWASRAIESFEAPYETRVRRELLPLDIIREEISVHARADGARLGTYRGYWWGRPGEVDPAAERGLRFADDTFAGRWASAWMVRPRAGCIQSHSLAPESIETVVINPSTAPPVQLQLSALDRAAPYADRNPIPTTANPPYVRVIMGNEVAPFIYLENQARLRRLLNPHLRARGWCPHSFTRLFGEKDYAADGRWEFTIRCD